MPALRFKTSLAAATLGMALAVLVQPGAGFAYTQEEQQACTPDAMRLCGDFVPNVDAITACMREAARFRRCVKHLQLVPVHIRKSVAGSFHHYSAAARSWACAAI